MPKTRLQELASKLVRATRALQSGRRRPRPREDVFCHRRLLATANLVSGEGTFEESCRTDCRRNCVRHAATANYSHTAANSAMPELAGSRNGSARHCSARCWQDALAVLKLAANERCDAPVEEALIDGLSGVRITHVAQRRGKYLLCSLDSRRSR